MQFQVTFKNQIATVPRFVNILLFLHSVAASPTIYSFGRTCSLQPHQMNEDSVFYVSLYNASEPNQIWCSHIAFSGHGSNSKDKYQICATPKMFLDPSCNLKLTLRNALNGTIFKTFSCYERPMSKFCAKQGEHLYFVAEIQTTEKWTPPYFLFHVEATKTYDHVLTVSGICGGVFGVFIIILIAVALKCRKMKASKPFMRRRFGNTPVSFFCNNASCDQESRTSSMNSGSGSASQTDDINSSPIHSGPYVIMHPLFNDFINSSGQSECSRSPPPYVKQDPPPEYSTICS